MEALIVLLLLFVFSVLAFRYGHDSLPRECSPEERLADAGFRVDDQTIAVGAELPGPVIAPVVPGGPFGQAPGSRTA